MCVCACMCVGVLWQRGVEEDGEMIKEWRRREEGCLGKEGLIILSRCGQVVTELWTAGANQ